MEARNETICITCGQAASPRRWNVLSDGSACPACRDRLLETLPAALPARSAPEAAPLDEAAHQAADPEGEADLYSDLSTGTGWGFDPDDPIGA